MKSAAAVVLLLAISQACSDTEVADGRPNELSSLTAPPVSVPEATEQGAEPVKQEIYANLGRLVATPEAEATVIIGAQNHLMRTCLERSGYSYQDEPVVPSNASALDAEVYPDEALLQQYGYGWRMHSSTMTPPSSGGPVDNSPEYLAAFDRCGSEAAAQLDFTRYGTAQQSISDASSQVAALAAADQRLMDALSAWSECMSSYGYHFSSPDESWSSTSGDPMAQTSLDLAVQDYRCQREVQLEETSRSVLSDYTMRWIEQNPGPVLELHDALAELTAIASQILEA